MYVQILFLTSRYKQHTDKQVYPPLSGSVCDRVNAVYAYVYVCKHCFCSLCDLNIEPLCTTDCISFIPESSSSQLCQIGIIKLV